MVAVERLAAAIESKREIRFVTDVCRSPLSATYYGMKALVPYRLSGSTTLHNGPFVTGIFWLDNYDKDSRIDGLGRASSDPQAHRL